MTAGQNYEADVAAFGGPTDDDRDAVATAQAEWKTEEENRYHREAESARQRREAYVAEHGRAECV